MNQIKIDPERVISDIDRNIFGGYLENKVYGGIYYPDSPRADKDGLRGDVRAALEQMRMSEYQVARREPGFRVSLAGRRRAKRGTPGTA